MGSSRLKSRRRQDQGLKWPRVTIALLSTVGLIDLKILTEENEKNYSFLDNLNNNKFKFLYLLGSDN